MKKKILLFSSLRKKKEILELTLNSYFNLVLPDSFVIDFLIQDDNDDIASKEYISALVNQNKVMNLNYKLDFDNFEGNHLWNNKQIDRITNIKNAAIEFALQKGYDFLFLVDADLVLNPKTLSHLINLKKDFVFEVFWTLFFGENYYKPNAWDVHSWSYFNHETILKLAIPGTYIVGGGGACTLLSSKILKEGLTFDRLLSLSYQGEDRHFCTRAQALGYDIWVDTHYPCYHIFNESQVVEANNWYSEGADSAFFSNWLDKEWELKVKKSFVPNNSFMAKIKIFIYQINRSFIKIFLYE